MTKHDMLRYSNVWEDGDILCAALEPFSENGRLLSISSTGDNVLALLTLDPEEIIAVDRNPRQLYCLELRLAAYKLMDYETLLQFLGVEQCPDRMLLYYALREHLSKEAAFFWDLHPRWIIEGVIHCGRLEKKMRIFQKWILPWIHAKWKKERFLKLRSSEQQENFYKYFWNTWLWKLIYPSFFRRALDMEKSRSEWFRSRSEHVFSQIPSAVNPYLHYFLTGNFIRESLPRYLRKDAFALIKPRIDRIKILAGPIQQASGKFDGFNLSDIFDSMEPSEFRASYEAILDRSNQGARIAYWNKHNLHERPKDFVHRAQNLKDLSQTLSDLDKVWFYQSFRVDEVTR